MKTIITYGTFDLTHKGHINILKRAKEQGDYLIVGLSTDEFNLTKNKNAIFSYEHRKTILEAIRYVDLVIPENNWDQKQSDILKHNVDIFVMGHDWTDKFNELKSICEVVYLPRTKNISTTMVKQIINDQNANNGI